MRSIARSSGSCSTRTRKRCFACDAIVIGLCLESQGLGGKLLVSPRSHRDTEAHGEFGCFDASTSTRRLGVFEDIPRRLREKPARLPRRDAERASTSTRRSSTATRSSSIAPSNVGMVPRERLLELGVTGPCCAPPASPGTCARSTPYLAYADFDFNIPVGTVGDGYDRYRVRLAEMRESVKIVEQCPRRPARGALHRRRPQGRAAAARRALDLDGGADPPLQARHRGLPRAAGRALLPDRVAARRAGLLRRSPTARRSRRASTSATPRSSTCSRCATCASAATSPT